MPRPRKLPEGIKKRGGVYYADFYAQGRRVRKRLSSQLDVAEELLHELQARADKADFGLLDNDYSLKELKDQYLRHVRQVRRPGTAESYSTCLENILTRLPATRVLQINAKLITQYREDRRGEGLSPRRINMETGALSTMLNWGVEADLIAANPIAGLEKLPHDHPKEGGLSQAGRTGADNSDAYV